MVSDPAANAGVWKVRPRYPRAASRAWKRRLVLHTESGGLAPLTPFTFPHHHHHHHHTQSYYYDGREVLNDADFDKLKEDLIWEGSPVAILSRDETKFLAAMVSLQLRRWLLLVANGGRSPPLNPLNPE